jgi:hypothetical protein
MNPVVRSLPVSLLITFAALTFTFAVVLYAVSYLLQGYFYSQPASWLPLRALAGGAVAAGFLTFWVYTNTRADSKDKYGTLFEFNSTASKPFDEFVAVRRYLTKDAEGKPREGRAKFVKVNGNFIEGTDTSKVFKLTTADYLVTAIEVPEGEAKVRFDAELFVPDEAKPGELRPWKPGDAAQPTYSREMVRTFREANGRRYIEFSQLGTPGSMQSPSRGAWVGAVLLNVVHLVIWFVVFWPILRFGSGVALGLAAFFCAATMLLAMPILFDRNKPPTPPPATAMRMLHAPG